MTDSKNLLTWDAALNENDKMRFLGPVGVYAPTAASGSEGSPVAPPKDYAGYVMSLSQSGVDYERQTGQCWGPRRDTYDVDDVGGWFERRYWFVPNTVVTRKHDCFGPQPEYTLRLAVPKSGLPLAIWPRAIPIIWTKHS